MKTWSKIAIGVAALIALGAVQNSFHATTAAPAVKVAADRPIDKVKVDNFKWHRGGFNAVALASFTIRNANSFDVKDVTLECDFDAQSGTTLSRTRHVVYQTVPAGKEIAVKDFNFGFIDQQVTAGGCETVKLVQ